MVALLKTLEKNGVLWILGWSVLFTVAMGLSKSLKGELPISMIVWSRLFLGLLVLSPWFFSQPASDKKLGLAPVDMLVRIASVYLALKCTYFAYTHLPLGLATAIGFTSPLMVALLSPFLVQDALQPKQWISIAVGYAGVWIVLSPETGASYAYILVGLAANFFTAIGLLYVKRLTNKNVTSPSIMFYSTLGAWLLTSLEVYGQWMLPTFPQLRLLAVIALLATACQWCYVEALKRGRPPVLASMEYSRLFIAIPVGLVWFQEEWFWSTLVGGAIILGSNIYMAKQASPSPATKGS